MLYGNQMTRRCTCPGKSPLETSKKRSKTVKSSCKNCGGKFVVDGIEPMSKSVRGTVGRGVASSITPEINWNTVTKGKRSRKAVARCMNRSSELGSKSPKRVGDFSGSDSDKLGETGNGQCLSDKPLKKRRHFYRSPSPSSRPSCGAESISPSQIPTLSSHSEGIEHLSDHNGSSGSHTNRLGRAGKDVDTGAVKVEASKLTNGVFYSPDFHGISLLAAAACINIEDVAFNVKAEAVEVSSAPQRSDGSTTSLPQTQIACSESGKLLVKPKDESVGLAAAEPVTSKVDRLHWDLNAPMEAWEQPIDDDLADSSRFDDTDGTQTTPVDKDVLAVDKVSKDEENDAPTVLPLNQIESAKDCYVSKSEENSSEGCRPQRFGVEESTLKGSSREELASLAPVDTKLSAPLLISNELCDDSPEAESCQSSEVSGLDAKSDTLAVALDKDSCKNFAQCHLSHHNVASRDDSGSEKCAALTDVPEDFQKITDFPVNGNTLGQELCLDILGAENPSGISANSTQPLLKHPSVTTSYISVAGVSHDEARLLADLAMGKGGEEDSSSKKILSKQEDPRTCKRKSDEEIQTDCHNLNDCQDMVEEAPKKLAEHEGGYDSPYEDGELRGSILYSWEENECVDGEQECVDYESDGRGGEEFEDGDFHDPNVVEADSEGTEKRSYLAVHDDTGALRSPMRRDLEKNNFEKTDDASAEKLSNQGSGTTEELAGDVIGRNYGRVRRHQAAADHLYADEERASGREEVRSRMNRGKFQPRFEGAASFDTMEGDFVPNRRFRDGAPNFRGRDGVPGRFYKGYRPDFHSRERNGGDGECDYWESRNRYPSGYLGRGSTRPRMTGPNSRGKFDQKPHPSNYSRRAERDGSPDRLVSRYEDRDRNGQVTYWEPPPRMRYPSMRYDGPPEENGQSRSRNVDKFSGFNKESMDYPVKNMQRPLGWNRSLNDNREFRGGPPRRFPGYNNGGGRGGGPRRFSEGFNRGGFREEYHPPSHDEDPSSWRVERRYISQSSRGHVSGPNRGSRSPSRTRSPRPWGPSAQRERPRRLSRSPEFRPRGPFQKPSFTADYDDSYMSPPPPPRGRFTSPHRSFRGEANDGSFRQRRPSYNRFRPSQRFDSGEGLNLEEADYCSYIRNRRQPYNAFRQGGLPEEGGLMPEESSRPGGDCFIPEESSRPGGECKTEIGIAEKEQDNRSEAVH